MSEFVNWKDKGVFSNPIWDQGKCSSCWAIATCTVVEANYKIKTGKSIHLSPQELVDFCPFEKKKTCEPDLSKHALEYMIENGITCEDEYPYLGDPSRPRPRLEERPQWKYTFKEVVDYEKLYTREAILEALKSSPVILRIQLTNSFKQWMNNWNIYAANRDQKMFPHAVVLVSRGWEGGKEYGVIRDSHGEGWGIDGYVRIDPNSMDVKGWVPVLIKS